MGPSQRMNFSFTCKDCSMNSFQNYRAEVSEIEFSKSGFSAEHLYNPFLVLYDKMKKIKE